MGELLHNMVHAIDIVLIVLGISALFMVRAVIGLFSPWWALMVTGPRQSSLALEATASALQKTKGELHHLPSSGNVVLYAKKRQTIPRAA